MMPRCTKRLCKIWLFLKQRFGFTSLTSVKLGSEFLFWTLGKSFTWVLPKMPSLKDWPNKSSCFKKNKCTHLLGCLGHAFFMFKYIPCFHVKSQDKWEQNQNKQTNKDKKKNCRKCELYVSASSKVGKGRGLGERREEGQWFTQT